mmetsp:Transcript_13672/g.31506  ORF Transcript_13672/g.31506 Transcript_13672/m.31506 type:complete len:186 (+) Transcript_13672:2013-2570(+)
MRTTLSRAALSMQANVVLEICGLILVSMNPASALSNSLTPLLPPPLLQSSRDVAGSLGAGDDRQVARRRLSLLLTYAGLQVASCSRAITCKRFPVATCCEHHGTNEMPACCRGHCNLLTRSLLERIFANEYLVIMQAILTRQLTGLLTVDGTYSDTFCTPTHRMRCCLWSCGILLFDYPVALITW